MIPTVLRSVSSLRFTLLLILSLAVTFLLGLWIPQKALLQYDLYHQWKAKSPSIVAALDALGFTDIYASPITLTLWALFFLNLALVMGKRIASIGARTAVFQSADHATSARSPFISSTEIPLSDTADRAVVRKVFLEAGYVWYGSSETFTTVRNRFSPLATLLFHLSFYLMLLGGVISVYTRFSGTVDLAEGEFFRAEITQYNKGFRLPKVGSPPADHFLVESIKPDMKQGEASGLSVILATPEGDRHRVEINRPYKSSNTSYVIQNLGVAPLIILRDSRGRELDGAYVKLNVLKGKKGTFTMGGLEFIVDFYPDHVLENEEDATSSMEIKNPVFRIDVQKGKRYLGRPRVRPGQEAVLDGYRLEIRELPYFVRLYVVKEKGLSILYAGFAIATIALVWRLVYYRRDIVGVIKHQAGKDMLLLEGRGEFYPVLFDDEFQRLVGSIRSQLAVTDKSPGSEPVEPGKDQTAK